MRWISRLWIGVTFIALAAVTACGAPAAATGPKAPVSQVATQAAQSSSDAVAGAVIFQNPHGEAPACKTCHYVDQPTILVGPSLQGVANRAGGRVAGVDTAAYLRQSIMEPNAFVLPDQDGRVFSVSGSSLMYQHFADFLTPAQVDDLVAYLST